MKTITVDFDDVLFRETGIRNNSLSLREVELKIGTAPYRLRITKQNVAGRETLYLGLYDPSDLPVEDIQVQYAGQLFHVEAAIHPESVVVPLTSGIGCADITLSSASLNWNAGVSVQLEQKSSSQPQTDETQASDFVINLLNKTGQILKATHPRLSPCPEPELLQAYASGELTAADAGRIADHVHQCLDCLDMVLEARAARHIQDEAIDIPLPAWLPASPVQTSTVPSSVSSENRITWRYPSVENFIQNMRKRWDRILEWPLTTMEYLTCESVLLSAPFQPGVAPLHAADHVGEVITAKWILMDNGDITDIRPISVIIHHQKLSENRFDISCELPSETLLDNITLLFGWMLPDGKMLSLTTMSGKTQGIFFSRSLVAQKALDPNGKLKMLIITDS